MRNVSIVKRFKEECKMEKLTIFGGGSWGTALADTAARSDNDVLLWSIERDNMRTLNQKHYNPGYLGDHKIHPFVRGTSDLDEAADHSDKWLFVVPTQYVRDVLSKLNSINRQPVHFCNAAKGLEISTMSRISQVAREKLPSAVISVLSGPSHAEEVIQKMPTAVVVASHEDSAATMWQEMLSTNYLRIYTSQDIAGVEIGGAVKNVIAIASGIAHTMKLGDNATAALVSRGLAEIMRLGAKMGAHPLTLAGLAGVGDLMVTCYSIHSRNYRLGMAIGEGKKFDEAVEELGQVAEGAYTVKAIVKLAKRLDVDLPLSQGVYSILYENVSPTKKLEELMTRDPKPEYPPDIYWAPDKSENN